MFLTTMISNNWIISLCVMVITSVLIAGIAVDSSYAFIKAFQQRGYSRSSYLDWVYKDCGKYTVREAHVSLFSIFSYVLFVTLFGIFSYSLIAYLGLVFIAGFNILFHHSQVEVERQKLDYTSRIKRLHIALFVIMIIMCFGLITLMDYLIFAKEITFFRFFGYSVLGLIPIIMPVMVALADIIVQPIENGRRKYYKKIAKEKLEKNKELITIGITGSFGKTSVKNILATILLEKYTVLASPKSYNTPMGISKTILEDYDNQQVFIAEMGARHKGDIRELAEFIPCDIGVITSVSPQHLEAFKTLDNILDTKFEIAENLKKDGVMFYSGDNEGSKKLYERNQGDKHIISIAPDNSGIISASNIDISESGSTFTLTINGESKEVSTVLLGKHNISNILLAVLVADSLSLNIEQIANGIEKISPIPHRLQILKGADGVTVIDDSYNANPHGVQAGCEILKMFKTKKIVITSGLVELGDLEQDENRKLGELLAESTDEVILIGKTRVTPIVEGLITANFKEEHIHIVDSLDNGMTILSQIIQKGTTVLFLNDLPDSYLT